CSFASAAISPHVQEARASSRALHSCSRRWTSSMVSPLTAIEWIDGEACQAHNLKVRGSNPLPATRKSVRYVKDLAGFSLPETASFGHFEPILSKPLLWFAFPACPVLCRRVHVTWMAHDGEPLFDRCSVGARHSRRSGSRKSRR